MSAVHTHTGDDAAPEVPGYAIESKLGVGGFATVYLARQLRLNRLVALKVMSAQTASGEEFTRRFLREGRDMALVSNHPGVVTVYDIDCQNGVYFIAMQYVPGPTLKDLMHSGAPYQHPLHIVRRIAGALAYAHDKGLVHRDIKPANILFNERHEAVLSDFGIARSMSRNSDLTEIGAVIGTASYMSPEQAQGLPDIDGRSDLYSLGVVLYELLTGEKPYRSAQATAVLLKHINEPVPVLPEEERIYQPLIDQMMAKQPNDRYASGHALLEDINNRYFRRENEAVTVAMPAASPPTATVVADADASAANNTSQHTSDTVTIQAPKKTVAIVGLALAVVLAIVAIPLLDLSGSDTTGAGVQSEVPAPAAVLNPKQQEQLQRLLDVAELHEAVGRLDSPPGANAIEAYQAVLALDANHPVATAAIARLQASVGDLP